MLTRIMAIAAGVFGTAAIVFWVMNLGPHGDPKPSATDWISAVGQAIGAIGTAGALWVGAITFRRQVTEQHRSQAAAVTLTMASGMGWSAWVCIVRNDSVLPIFDVALVGVDATGVDVPGTRHERPYLPGTVQENANAFKEQLGLACVKTATCLYFTDASGVKWKRSGDAVLEEVKAYRYLNREGDSD